MFTHLHTHTDFSMLDGMTSIEKLVTKIKEDKQEAFAITDHGGMYGLVKAATFAKKHGAKHIAGCEFYIVPDNNSITDKVKGHHLVLLAKNEIGYKNLVILNNAAWCMGFYYKPRIDMQLLAKHSEGLICLSACIAGYLPQLIIENKFDDAVSHIQLMKQIFNDDYYLEIQDHGITEERLITEWLCNQPTIKHVVTIDSHYLNENDFAAHDALLAININEKVDSNDRKMQFNGSGYWLMTENEVRDKFHRHKTAIDNTNEIAEKCACASTYLLKRHAHLPQLIINDKEFDKWKTNPTYILDI